MPHEKRNRKPHPGLFPTPRPAQSPLPGGRYRLLAKTAERVKPPAEQNLQKIHTQEIRSLNSKPTVFSYSGIFSVPTSFPPPPPIPYDRERLISSFKPRYTQTRYTSAWIILRRPSRRTRRAFCLWRPPLRLPQIPPLPPLPALISVFGFLALHPWPPGFPR